MNEPNKETHGTNWTGLASSQMFMTLKRTRERPEEDAENEIESAYGSMASRVDDKDESEWSLSPSSLPFSLSGGQVEDLSSRSTR